MKKCVTLMLILTFLVLYFSGCGKTEVPLMTNGAETLYQYALTPDMQVVSGVSSVSGTPAYGVPSGLESIVSIYNTVYNNTKADLLFKGSDDLSVVNVTLDGMTNSYLDGIVRSVVGTIYQKQTLPLPPYSSSNSYQTCIFTAADALSADWQDLGNGEAEIRIIPKPSENSHLGEGQGKMFNVISDMREVFTHIPQIYYSWTEGDTDSNVTASYSDGYCVVRYNTQTMKMVSAQYVMHVTLHIKNLKVLLAAHDASIEMTYTQVFPAV